MRDRSNVKLITILAVLKNHDKILGFSWDIGGWDLKFTSVEHEVCTWFCRKSFRIAVLDKPVTEVLFVVGMSVAFRELLDTNDPKKAKRSNLKLSNILNRSKDPVEMSGSAKETGNTKKPSLDSFVHCKSLKSTNGQHAKRFDGLSKSFNVAKESPLVTEVSQFKIAQSKQGNKQSNSSCKRKIPSTESEETSEEGFLNVRKKHGKRRMVIEYSDEEDYAPKKIISSSEITVLPHENVKTEEKDSENNDDALESEQSETSISEDSSDPVLEVLKTCEALSKKMRDRLQPLHGTEITKPLSKLITQV